MAEEERENDFLIERRRQLVLGADVWEVIRGCWTGQVIGQGNDRSGNDLDGQAGNCLSQDENTCHLWRNRCISLIA